jgi:hypothetical protein
LRAEKIGKVEVEVIKEEDIIDIGQENIRKRNIIRNIGVEAETGKEGEIQEVPVTGEEAEVEVDII